MRIPSSTSLLVLVASSSWAIACSGGEVAPVDHDQRRSELRTTLQAQLGETYAAPVAQLGQADLEKGESVYQRSCSGCHGDNGDGKGHRAPAIKPAPANLVDGRGRDFYSDAGQLQLIRDGVPMTAMPPFGRSLKEEDLVAAYAYVVSLRN